MASGGDEKPPEVMVKRRRGEGPRLAPLKGALLPQRSGDRSAVAPPVSIPNTAVKRRSPDGSAA